ncbi:sugar ABC transporter substrate-binding protein [Paenibacillus sp. IB182496]|uniref:Sugar ABC transporter substrate-binding protein n=1 Tax=Paenibacillus sabuli TaxID=2772509 RepID=A0A927BRK6_9BACL|nr:extracellular solute-binding protein [Paenibacillus sabuli]MBD2845473.1 sugar ABC transporter substrate-binding protein [Paenibacillus sabuli]
MFNKKKGRTTLALLLGIAVLSGCGANNGNTPDDNGASASPTAAPKEATSAPTDKKDPVTLTLWDNGRERDDWTIQFEESFLKAHPHITLNKVVKEGDPGNAFYQAVAAGNAPDLVGVSFAMMDKYMKAGILEPLNSYVSQWDEWGHYTKEYADMFTKDGQILGLPGTIAPMLFGYNKALFADAGITELPQTWNDAIEVAKKINNPSSQIAGYATLAAEWTEWFFQYYVWQAGGDLTKMNADGTAELTFTDPAVIKAAEFYKKLRSEKVMQSDLTLKFDDLVDQFAQGKIGMMPFAGDWVSMAVSKGMNPDDLGLMLPPAGPSGSRATAIAGGAWVINAKTTQAKKDAAWEYLKFYHSRASLIGSAENKASKGASNPLVSPRDDIAYADYYKFPEEYSDVLNQVNTVGRLEFYGKADFGIYVDRAVQKILTDPNADPTKEFEAAQKLAASEALDNFNAKATE